MSAHEIAEVVDGFAASATNLLTAGYDGIEIHGAHGYLVAQFMSPLTNRRRDAYGGSFENRMRFPLDVVHAIRHRCGHGFILGFRLSAIEELEGGLTLEDTVAIARVLRESGGVDYLSVAIGVRGGYVKDMAHPVGLALKYAAAVREAVGLPVIASQRITHPTEAENALVAGQADLIGIGRALIADPDWVLKAREGRLGSILPCVGCLQNCRSYDTGVTCLHSPATGRELSLAHQPARAATCKRVVVVGAGPGGLEAARIAAERGHAVIVYEREAAPGGQVRLAARAPYRAGLDGVVSFRMEELRRLGVDLRFATEATASRIQADRPDAVVLATGAIPVRPDIEASEDARILTVWELFSRLASAGRGLETGLEAFRACVVVDVTEGLWESCSAAEALAEQGIAVTIVTPARQIGAAIPPESLGPLYTRLRRHNVSLSPMTAVSAVARGWVSAYDPVWLTAHHALKERQIEADFVVWCGDKRPDDGLAGALAGIVPELHAVGDCVAPRRISTAVLEGHRAALAI
jgi:2,4-dienoyl-CoA reductase (NADPH2)